MGAPGATVNPERSFISLADAQRFFTDDPINLGVNPEHIPNLRHAHEQLNKELNVPFEIGKPHPAFGGGVVTDILRSGLPQPQR